MSQSGIMFPLQTDSLGIQTIFNIFEVSFLVWCALMLPI